MAYRRVRWLLAAVHALVPYGAVGNIVASARREDMIASRWDEQVSHHQVVTDLE